ncbi:MAG: 2-C-methyl-D-erythritol 2,4-cyclodiphosphate synthase [Nitriliruptoraceae bacterium]
MTGRVGSGLDVHRFGDDPERPLLLCGVEVAGAPGLAGHSDGDVAAHAVADALLGAAALGDLGSRFGTDLDEHAGADSMHLLAEVVADVAAAGWVPVSLDLTVVAQRPRLGPHREAMRQRLATTCHLDLAAVSVKFTTTDGLGAIGSGEGIAAWCTGMLRPGG